MVRTKRKTDTAPADFVDGTHLVDEPLDQPGMNAAVANIERDVAEMDRIYAQGLFRGAFPDRGSAKPPRFSAGARAGAASSAPRHSPSERPAAPDRASSQPCHEGVSVVPAAPEGAVASRHPHRTRGPPAIEGEAVVVTQQTRLHREPAARQLSCP